MSLDKSLQVWQKKDLLPPPSQYEAYMAAVQKFPFLSLDEEAELIKKWREDHDKEAARKLVLSHLRLVTKVVNEHSGYGLFPGDLAQEGTVGLMKAVQRFDPIHGVRLAAYALLWIQAEIREFILLNWRMVKLSGSSAKKLFFGYRKAHKKLEKLGSGRVQKVSLGKMAKELDVSLKELNAAESYFRGGDVAIVNQESNEEENYDSHTISHQLISLNESDEVPEHLKTPAETFEDLNQKENLHIKLQEALLRLPAREREVVVSRRLQDPAMSLQELGEKLGVSAERVRQIEAQGFLKLKENLFSFLPIL